MSARESGNRLRTFLMKQQKGSRAAAGGFTPVCTGGGASGCRLRAGTIWKKKRLPWQWPSTTKIMTCILVLENAKVEEEVSISAYAATMPKVKLYVKKGEHYTVRELLFSLMLESHNDAAAALAEYIGGKLLGETKEASEHTTEESKAALHRFAQAMNEKAVEIGCEDTWFITPNGLDATETLTLPDGSILEKEHHTTAKDLACILRYCIRESSQRDLFREITRTQEYCFTENGRSFQCHNHNAFLQMMDGCFYRQDRIYEQGGVLLCGSTGTGWKMYDCGTSGLWVAES